MKRTVNFMLGGHGHVLRSYVASQIMFYRAFVRSRVRHGFRLLSTGQLDALAAQFTPDAVFSFPGEHRLGGERRGPQAIRAWFDETRRLFPDFRVEPRTILVQGGPRRTRVATQFDVYATFPDGAPYRNTGMQLLELRWGRVRQDRLFEDTQLIAAALDRLPQLGMVEDTQTPSGSGAADSIRV